MKEFKVLDVGIDEIGKSELLGCIESSILNREKCLIYTVNNEFILEAQKNDRFREVLNSSTFSIADSAGMVWAVNYLYAKKIERIPGADLFIDLVKLSRESDYRIFLLGGKSGVGEKTKEVLEKKFPKCKIVGFIDGITIDAVKPDEEIITKINEAKPDILCVALGAPKQEIWIHNNFKKIDCSVFIGVGGTFDFVSGKVKRAPRFMRNLSLEWLYRLFVQPSRAKRIYNALVVFPRLVKRSKK